MSGQNSNIKTIKKLHNPKSYAPAVYIPCWLIQVPHNLLSFGAKLLYGRLAQWSNTKGDVFRSAKQLSKELGMGIRTIEKFIKELKEVGLIGTFHPQAGGLNHFVFYDHEWMDIELTEELDPPHNHAVPSAQPCGTPPHNHADINIKEIKEIKKDILEVNLPFSKNQNYTPEFLEFWATTNKKGSKWNAYKAWRSLKLDHRLDEIKQLWGTYYKNDFKQREFKFCPNISSWLNEHPWDNEKIPALPATQNTFKTQNKAPRSDFSSNAVHQNQVRSLKSPEQIEEELKKRNEESVARAQKQAEEFLRQKGIDISQTKGFPTKPIFKRINQ